ncbi:MAG: hypothetical protein WBF99_12625 [Xanthobacteraceae bacterium]
MQVTDEMVRVAAEAISTHPDGGNITPGSSLLTAEVLVSWEPLARAALTAALAAMWRPIEEAPKDGERILLGFRGSMSAEGYWHDGSRNHWNRAGWYFADDDVLTGRPCDPDCWQTLPSPPEKEV